MRELLGLEKPLAASIRAVLPQALQRKDLTNWLMLAVTVFLALEANSLRGHFHRKIENLGAFQQFEALSAMRHIDIALTGPRTVSQCTVSAAAVTRR